MTEEQILETKPSEIYISGQPFAYGEFVCALGSDERIYFWRTNTGKWHQFWNSVPEQVAA